MEAFFRIVTLTRQRREENRGEEQKRPSHHENSYSSYEHPLSAYLYSHSYSCYDKKKHGLHHVALGLKDGRTCRRPWAACSEDSSGTEPS